ncbi:MAG: class I SAM-dependent methyltransferase [Hyphomicrobiaceae bacterium]|nr:class I SAM-dependent methyltransferase [Hyphomicrobiaceae bacterium]
MTTSTRTATPADTAPLSLDAVQRSIGRHLPVYQTYPPSYHAELLRGFRAVWDDRHARVLDVGGGTGIIAQAMKDLFAIPSVTSVDIEDRFLKTIDIETSVYDGARLPFADGAFDCAVFSNVLHHVPVEVRPGLMADVARVTGHGPIYIKDHIAASTLDHARLFALDAIGNVPFGGMVKARYLTLDEWQALAARTGYRIDTRLSGTYRGRAYATIFPNRLETTMKWVGA